MEKTHRGHCPIIVDKQAGNLQNIEKVRAAGRNFQEAILGANWRQYAQAKCLANCAFLQKRPQR